MILIRHEHIFKVEGCDPRALPEIKSILAEILKALESNNMKLSEVKAAVAASAAKSTEAFAELGTRIGDLQKQIDDLIAGNSDPDVTDESFLANLNTLKTNVDQLAEIVPNAPSE